MNRGAIINALTFFQIQYVENFCESNVNEKLSFNLFINIHKYKNNNKKKNKNKKKKQKQKENQINKQTTKKFSNLINKLIN